MVRYNTEKCYKKHFIQILYRMDQVWLTKTCYHEKRDFIDSVFIIIHYADPDTE